jgi:hypothetical protein
MRVKYTPPKTGVKGTKAMENKRARCTTLHSGPSPQDLLERFLRLPPKQRDEEFWPVKKVAEMLNKHPSTIRRMADEDKIPHTKVVGTIYVNIPMLKQRLKADSDQ